METLIYPYKISLRFDESLADLLNYGKNQKFKTKQELNLFIMDILIKNGYAVDSNEDAGKSLIELLFWNDLDINQFAVKHIGFNTQTFERLLSNLTIWGVNHECPECGSDFEYHENIRKCTNPNCDYWDDITHEVEQEKKYDVRNDLNFNYFLN
jgi:hypothetical protein